ncbi:MAG: hypothetical protein PHE56_11285 [Bacteroidales bacterium]|nr:hypothetical protein [Bacteroidales bacterium]
MNIICIWFTIILSLALPASNSDSQSDNPNISETKECSNLYPFDSYYIDLETNSALLIDGIPSTDFKKCSKYSRKFANIISDSVCIGNRTFVLDVDSDHGKYDILILENNKLISAIHLPVENPLPEVQDYSVWIFPYGESLIMFMEDMYSTHYIICKYDKNGKELNKTMVENTFVTHPDKETDYHHRYLYFKEIIGSEMIFTSHIAFAEKSKTVVLSLNDFTTKEYDITANGLIADETETKLAGFAENKDEKYEVILLDGRKFSFDLKYADPACDFILQGNNLFIANYHPIATGSSLYCYDISAQKIKWQADVKQVNASHSEYYNTVIISTYKNKIVMEGNEAYGNYVQIFDAESGKRLAAFGDFISYE